MATMQGSVPDDPHKDIQARYFRSELKTVKAAVFLFHGRGGDGDSVYQQLGQHLLRDDLVIVVPQAYSNCWYPYRFNEPTEVNQPWLDSAINWIHNEVSSFSNQGLSPEKIFFGGFSQGSCLALEYPLRYPQRYGGVICLSGGVIGPLDSRKPLGDKVLQDTPVFLGCADEDEWIPRDKFDESVELFKESGADVSSKIYEGIGHTICEDELDNAKAIIAHAFEAN